MISISSEIIGREDARRSGARHNFTGEPCLRGHVSPRNVRSGICLECGKENSRNFYKDHARETIATVRNWRAQNAAKIHKHKSDYNRKNRESIRLDSKSRREAYPLRVLTKQHNTRAKRCGAVGTIKVSDIQKLLREQDEACAICRCSFKTTRLSLDHDLPLSRGGSNNPSNIQLLCLSCNLRKGRRTTVEYLRTINRTVTAQEIAL